MRAAATLRGVVRGDEAETGGKEGELVIWFAVRVALGAYLLSRRRAGRMTVLFAGLLLPRPLRSIAKLAIVGKLAARGIARRRRDRAARSRGLYD